MIPARWCARHCCDGDCAICPCRRLHAISNICVLPTGLHKARTGALVPRQGPNEEIIPLPGMYFFDGWRVEPRLKIPENIPQTQDMPVRITARAPVEGAPPARQAPEDEARDILAAAVKNQVECGPGTRRAAVPPDTGE